MRLQLALNVKDLDAAVDFYSKMFGVPANKREPGYANFAVESPPLKLVLFESPDAPERLNHLGVEVFEDEDVQFRIGGRIHWDNVFASEDDDLEDSATLAGDDDLDDLQDIHRRLQRLLSGRGPGTGELPQRPAIVLAHHLGPADAAIWSRAHNPRPPNSTRADSSPLTRRCAPDQMTTPISMG